MEVQASPVDKVSHGFWDLYSKHYDSVYHLMPYRKMLWDAFQALDLSPGARVLDAGCGTGNFERFISEKHPPAIEVEAFDFSPSMLEVARDKCAALDWVHFCQGDLNARLPFPDASFDCVVSINVMYTLPDRDHTMQELLRVLKPGGRLVITGPAPGYRWAPLVAEHFRRVRNIWGTGRQALSVLSSVGMLCTSAVGAFLLNVFVIYRREKAGEYHAMDETELRTFLGEHRRDGLGDFSIMPSFAAQNLFATALKAA